MPNVKITIWKELLEKYKRVRIHKRLYLSVADHSSRSDTTNFARTMDPRPLCVSSAPCPGGAWSQYGWIDVKDGDIIIDLKEVWGIIRHQHRFERFVFPYAQPGLFEDIDKLLRDGAANSQKAFNLGSKRSWRRHRREFKIEEVF